MNRKTRKINWLIKARFEGRISEQEEKSWNACLLPVRVPQNIKGSWMNWKGY
ncbi:MAG: hypothetical protein U5Q03_01795 [Bacteroidota bacterium]|nr:hypothetical protein [Bacteroidota bacterium]